MQQHRPSSSQEKAQIAETAAELDARQDQSQSSYLERVGHKRMSELIARELVQEAPVSTDGSQTVEPAEWPTDPDHPLNSPELVEQMSTEQFHAALQQWWSSPEYLSQVEAARQWRDRPDAG